MLGKSDRRDFLRRAAGATLALPLLARAPIGSAARVPAGSGKTFRGIFVILQTPFTLHDQLEEEDLEREVKFCLRAGAQGLVWPQLAGEFYVLSEAERRRGAEIVLRSAGGSCPVVIGVQATSKEIAIQFARHAESKGADAVISLPPYRGSVTLETVADYYRAIAAAVRLPVFIQNSGGEWGPALPTSFVIQLARENPQLAYIKEEIAPVPHRLGEYKSSGVMKGIFSGNAGRNLLNELARGASGTMPACEFADVDAQIYTLAAAGKWVEARALAQKLLPMIILEETYGVAFAKAVLVRRGIFKTAKRRGVASLKVLDLVDEQELDAWWDQLAPYLRV
jgi:dihydrodipicolinate synthase/N-acetylneuraminate lyase